MQTIGRSQQAKTHKYRLETVKNWAPSLRSYTLRYIPIYLLRYESFFPPSSVIENCLVSKNRTGFHLHLLPIYLCIHFMRIRNYKSMSHFRSNQVLANFSSNLFCATQFSFFESTVYSS